MICSERLAICRPSVATLESGVVSRCARRASEFLSKVTELEASPKVGTGCPPAVYGRRGPSVDGQLLPTKGI